MKLVMNRNSARWVLRWTQRVLLTCAASLLGYCGFALFDAWAFDKRESLEFERWLQKERGISRVAPQAVPPAPRQGPPATAIDGLIGRMEITRLRISAVVIEGTAAATLRRAVGHIFGTGLPGEPGNIGLAGHRDTFFRPLRNIRRDDVITITTLRGDYRYRVVSTSVVDSHDIAVLNPDGTEVLTLVTCHPFYLLGSAPNRFIVRAKRIAADTAVSFETTRVNPQLYTPMIPTHTY